ncbi:MAG: tetratricopeptide repeat protein [Verrucomicrobiota bacterium]|nr:tetratricopeptide repeat protein [Verrucomicrobiota bacterium]
MKLPTVLLVLLSLGATASAQHSPAVARGNENYLAGRIPEAVEQYQTAVRNGEANAPLFHNLGNASYRAGDLGGAILNYERALALEPGNPEVATNLHVARDQARALQLKESALDQVLRRLQPGYYAVAGAVAFWVAAFAIVALWRAQRRSAALVTLLAFSVLLLAASVAAAYRLETGPRGSALAVVTGKNVEARLATADTSGTVLVLPAGSEVQLLSTRGEWSYAALPNGSRGWIPAASAERVRL